MEYLIFVILAKHPCTGALPPCTPLLHQNPVFVLLFVYENIIF